MLNINNISNQTRHSSNEKEDFTSFYSSEYITKDQQKP